MVEYVKGIHTELGLYTLSDTEILRYRQIGSEEPGPAERIAANVTKSADSRSGERTRERTQRGKERRGVSCWIKFACSHMERTRPFVGAANTHVLLAATFRRARRPRQAAAPVTRTSQFPAPDDQVFSTAGVANERLSPAER